MVNTQCMLCWIQRQQILSFLNGLLQNFRLRINEWDVKCIPSILILTRCTKCCQSMCHVWMALSVRISAMYSLMTSYRLHDPRVRLIWGNIHICLICPCLMWIVMCKLICWSGWIMVMLRFPWRYGKVRRQICLMPHELYLAGHCVDLCPVCLMVLGRFIHTFWNKINEQVENLWNVETNLDDDVISWSHDDRRVIDLWNEQTEFVYGHYCLPIPWKGGEPCMPNNKWIAMTRLKNLTTRLKRTGLCEKYEHNLFDLVEKNYAEPVPTEELTLNDGSVWYLPHHNVTNKSKPDKFRIVFDCAAKYSGVSLNSECLQGPDLCNKLLHVLLRFRQFKLAITADIEAMYHQVKIPPKHRNCLRFLWEQDGCISEYRMTSHLFGGVWCSCSSTYALRQCVKDETCSNLVKATVNHAFYVDDMLKSVASVDDGIDVIKGTKQVLAARGFNLTKFMTNDNNILREIPLDERAHETREITPELSSKALGMMWNVSDDIFYYVSKFHDDQVTPVTKRLVLSRVSSLYDPLGLIGPVVMLGKLLFQEAVRLKLSWDAEVPPTLSDRWTNWLQTLYDIHKLRFDRCVVPDGFQEAAMELHHFCDASLSGYGACSFLRLTNRNGRIHTALLMA